MVPHCKGRTKCFVSAFRMLVLFSVDDAFWAATDFRMEEGTSLSECFFQLFQRVVFDFLGLQIRETS